MSINLYNYLFFNKIFNDICNYVLDAQPPMSGMGQMRPPPMPGLIPLRPLPETSKMGPPQLPKMQPK